MLLSVTMALSLEMGAMKAKLFLLTFDESKTAMVSLAMVIMVWLMLASSMLGVDTPLSRLKLSTPKNSLSQ